FAQEIPLPFDSPIALCARRTGHSLCYADNEYYNMVDLEQASLYQLLPLRQSEEPTPWHVKPLICVIGENEFLILSWTGASALGVFITGEGDPVRGTLEWGSYPKAICLDYPYVTSLLPNETIEIHSVETQSMTQVIPPPTGARAVARLALVASLHGYLVPSTQRSGKLRKVKVGLAR
ncbi:Vacuolar protein sorting-associated protein 3, partial [Leucoagaricus sp. SymC.cos]